MKIMSLRTYKIVILFGLAFGFLVSFLGTYIVFKIRGWGIGTILMAIVSPTIITAMIAIAYHNAKITFYGYPGRRIKIPFMDTVENMLYDARGIESPLRSKEADKDKS
jgi:hypothetical protein